MRATIAAPMGYCSTVPWSVIERLEYRSPPTPHLSKGGWSGDTKMSVELALFSMHSITLDRCGTDLQLFIDSTAHTFHQPQFTGTLQPIRSRLIRAPVGALGLFE